MRTARKANVLYVLSEWPKQQEGDVWVTNIPANELLVRVWQRELHGGEFTPENITQHCSSAEGILRDRRRVDVIEKYPRSEDNYAKYIKYKEEFSEPPVRAVAWMNEED